MEGGATTATVGPRSLTGTEELQDAGAGAVIAEVPTAAPEAETEPRRPM